MKQKIDTPEGRHQYRRSCSPRLSPSDPPHPGGEHGRRDWLLRLPLVLNPRAPAGHGIMLGVSDWSMKCGKCGESLGGLDASVAHICVRPMGDEEDRNYFLCLACDVYTAWICHEPFFTDNVTTFAAGPIAREEGDRIVAEIRKCASPTNPACRCPSHEALSDPSSRERLRRSS